MTTPAKSSRRQTSKASGKTTAKAPKSGAARGKTSPAARNTKQQGKASAASQDHHDHDLTVTIPVDRAASTAVKALTLPITTAQRILPAKGGLPLYLGLGALGLAGILEWPVAAGIGAGYAILRRGGPLNPRPNATE